VRVEVMNEAMFLTHESLLLLWWDGRRREAWVEMKMLEFSHAFLTTFNFFS
jgi:hypothetical protein